MRVIVEMRAGSHLYGTATPASDTDIKGVFVPDGRDLLLQRVPQTVSSGRAKAAGERNRPDDVDRELFSLQRYLELLAEGQTVAVDMLFAPDAVLCGAPDPLWQEIRANAGRLVSRRASTFVRYCRQQASRFGMKGARMAAARAAAALLAEAEAKHGTVATLSTVAPALEALAREHAAIGFADLPMPGGRIVRHLDIGGRRAAYTGSIKAARSLAERMVESYGARARQAESNEGVDWKALSHAVRVGREALELLRTGRIVFPLACAPHLLAIKRGELPYDDVAAAIDRLLLDVEGAAERSTLRDAPDLAFIEALVLRAHRAAILEAS